ncbi:MAG: hypothetical protein RL156_692 [Bacteroidota bacterium]
MKNLGESIMNKPSLLSAAGLLAVCMVLATVGHAKDIDRTQNKGKNRLMRTFSQNDLQRNTVSKIQFYTTNYGIFGLNVAGNSGGGFWPRNSGNQYIFGGGVWFAALKRLVSFDSTTGVRDTVIRKMSEISYNPNSGESWLSPGRIEDGDAVMTDAESIAKYRTYFSTDFKTNGAPRVAADGPNWAIWDSKPAGDTLSFNKVNKEETRYFGEYINDIAKRNIDSMPLLPDGRRKGPVYVSDEDIFSTYKDTDLRRFEDGADVAKSRGYPLRMQFEQTVYTWGFGEYENFLFIAYNIINRSTDTLNKCWMAPAYDFDIGPNGGAAIASNDRVNYYSQDTTLNLAFQWSETNNAVEKGKGFGYIGMDFLESPAVDSVTKFIRHDKGYYHNDEQIGLRTFRNWVIANDPTSDVGRYDFMALGQRDGDGAAGDKRFLMATGPFNMAPGDTARVVLGIIFAPPAAGLEASGTTADLAELVYRDKFAQKVYDDQFATPRPPDVGSISWKPLNNAVIIQWDSTAEASVDKQERGMDFLGYRLFRARINKLDTFDVDMISSSPQYSLGKGPFGWKQIAQWECPRPFASSGVKVDSSSVLSPTFPEATILAKTGYNTLYPGLFANVNVNDTNVFLVRRLPNISAEPWRSFFNPLIPRAPYSKQIPYDTLTLGIFRVRSNGTVPRFSQTDTAAIRVALRSLFKQAVEGKAELVWFRDDIENSALFRSLVDKHMDSITGNRRYVDYGDDNNDGIITTDPDLTKTEKLINNVDYYYKLLAYDEGDYFQRTPIKTNSGVEQLNLKQAFPLAQGTASNTFVSSVEYDTNSLGGLHNFRVVPGDQQRLNDLYGGHTIQLEFKRNTIAFNGAYAAVDTAYDASSLNLIKGLYSHTVSVKDLTSNLTLANYNVYYEPRDCSLSGLFSEASVVYASPSSLTTPDSIALDSSTFISPFNRNIVTRSGSFTSDRSCNAPDRFINGALGIAFDYTLQQFGGYLRVDGVKKVAGEADVQMSDNKINSTPNERLQRTRINGNTLQYETYNNGPGRYEVEFLPGGTETINSRRLRRYVDSTKTPPVPVTDTVNVQFVDVPYLNVRVRNTYSFKRFDAASQDSIEVANRSEIPHSAVTLPVTIAPSQPNGTPTVREYPDPQAVPIGSFNISANGWVNGRYNASNIADKESNTISKVNSRRYQALEINSGRPVAQGRYYLSKIQNNDTLDFTHFFLIDGAEYMLDFAAKGGRSGATSGGRTYERQYEDSLQEIPLIPKRDFAAGDKIMVSTFGGAFGLPKDGAKVTFKLAPSEVGTDGAGNQNITDDMLDKILVVPNPYVISTIAQKSTYDAKIFFTRLPKVCTIRIYTVNGDLVRTIQHTDQDGTDRQGMDVWDLLSDNKQRSTSQGMFSVIETPNGAKTIKKFSIVVGGARFVR